MTYIGKPFLNVPVNSFAKEDFVGSDTGTNNSIANSLLLTREIPGLNASNEEMLHTSSKMMQTDFQIF